MTVSTTDTNTTATKFYPGVDFSNNKPRRGITKADAYIARIHCAEYDLEEMLIAYGVKRVTELLIELHTDLKQGKRYRDRSKNQKKILERVAA